eukprot:7897642-Pyramimonas_sp.AAC.1
MQQPNAPHASGSFSVRTSSVGLLQPELRAKIDSTSQDHSDNTHSFADLAQVTDPVQTFRCNGRTGLMSPNRFL